MRNEASRSRPLRGMLGIAGTCVALAGLIATAVPASAQQCDGKAVPCAIGDTGPGGGIVLYDAGKRKEWGRYLEWAPDYWHGPGWDPTPMWCSPLRRGYRGYVPTSIEMGSGPANTEAIVKACGRRSAAGMVAAYRGGGKDDWFLPSREELRAMFRQLRERRDLIPVLLSSMRDPRMLFPTLEDDVEAQRFWTSSTGGKRSHHAWFGSVLPLEFTADDKRLIGIARPVRAF